MASIPGSEPLNLLALDGGGIRGVSELVILHEIMSRVQQRGELQEIPKPCEYFHLIGGTSTGGLVAIMLGRLRMSTEDALKAYDQFAGQIFSDKNRKMNPGQRWTEMYKATGLRDTVQQLVKEQTNDEAMMDSTTLDGRGKSFVCSKPVGEHRRTVRFRSYDVKDNLHKHVKIWEAARATTAAPLYFKSMTITDDMAKTENFVDGAIGCNNPTEILFEEADLLYGKQRKVGCVVSLGTGTKVQELAETANGLRAKTNWAKSLALVMKEIMVDCEDTHDRVKKQFESFSDTYFRFNVAGGAQGIKLEDWTRMEELKQKTQAYLQRNEIKYMIDDLADVLLQKRPCHGLTVGHLGGLHRDNILLDTQIAIDRGHASRIFTGRENILRKMERIFGPREPEDDTRREFHLRGLGGVGKTQIALKFADLNERRFKIIWVDATNTLTIEQSYKKYAERLLHNQDSRLAVQLVLQWLQDTDDEWLLVFDNASEHGLRQYIPDGYRGNIIYTSRPHRLEEHIPPAFTQDVDSMEHGDAITLLLKAGEIDARSVEARKLGRVIVDELGCLPLAIDQAGAYIHYAPCPLEKYLEVYNEEKELLLRNPPFRGEDQLRNLPVYTTFNISYAVIRAYAERRRDLEKAEHAASAIHILSTICFYHNQGFVRDIFSCAAYRRAYNQRNKHYPLRIDEHCLNELVDLKEEDWDFEKFDGGIRLLRDFSLLKCDDDAKHTTMHVLVHEWARGRLDKSSRAQYGLVARAILFDSITFIETMPFAIYRRDMLPHIEACQKYYGGRHDDDILEAEYDCKYALVQQEAYNFREAKVALKRAISTRQFEFSLLAKDTLEAMAQLGDLYLQEARYGEAEAIFLECITRRQMALLEARGAMYGRTRNVKGWAYPGELRIQQHLPTDVRSKGKEPEKADESDEPTSDTDMPEDNAQYGSPLDDSKIVKYKIRLARAYQEQGQLHLARDQAKDLVKAYKRRYGATSNKSVLRKAISYFRALEQVVTTGNFQKMSSIEAREALDAAKCLLGHTASRTMSLKKKLARALEAEHQFKEAEDLYVELYAYNKEHFGETALETIGALCDLASMFNAAERWMESEDLHRVALRVRENKLGQNHPDTLQSMQDIALSLGHQARIDEALPLARECVERQTAILGADHYMTKASRSLVERLLILQPACTPAIQILMRNIHMETLILNMGDFVSQWAREWQPEPVVIPESERLFWNESLRRTRVEVVAVNGSLELHSIESEVVGSDDLQ